MLSMLFTKQRSCVARRNVAQLFSVSFIGVPRHQAELRHAYTFRTFSVLAEQTHNIPELPMFTVGALNGFLPRQDPLVVLPDEFNIMESLLKRMPLQLLDGNPGLLAKGQFGEAVNSELPFYDVEQINDQRLLSALFRDYSFLASAYLLEPCNFMYTQKNDYGLGRSVLPMNIAVPFDKVAKKLSSKPFMEYAMSYILNNYKRLNPSCGVIFKNLDVVRSFTGIGSEKGFILNHVTMVAHTPKIVNYAVDALNAVENKDRTQFNQQLSYLNDTYETINNEMEMMWSRSIPGDYLKFRTFIFGTKNQPMFPNGVIYEGVSDQPIVHRGESGANDSIIPLADNLLQITMPDNPLTVVLKEFRSYRPANHREFLEYIKERAQQTDFKKFALQDANSAAIYLSIVDQVRDFRFRHWNFTKEYIIKYSVHPVATGGSPIVTWLPNQLRTVLDLLIEVGENIDQAKLNAANRVRVFEISKRAMAQKRFLEREIEKIGKRFNDKDKTE